jgi:hypothetical protein
MGLPNLLMPAGPQIGSASTNYPRGIETGFNWSKKLLEYMLDCAHVTKMYSAMLMRKAKSCSPYNSNVPAHEHGKIRYLVYNGGSPKYVAKINEVAERDYEGIALTSGSIPSGAHETGSTGEKIPH